MQFVATWVDGVTAGVRGTLTALEKVKRSAGEADAALKKASSPRAAKAPGAKKEGPRPFDKLAFQEGFLAKRRAAQERDDAISGLGMGVSRKEKDRDRLEKSEAKAQEKKAKDQARARDHVLGIRDRFEKSEAKAQERHRKDQERAVKLGQREDDKRKANSFGAGVKSVFGGKLGGAALGVTAAAALVAMLGKAWVAAKNIGVEFTKLTLGPMGLARANALISVAQLRFQRMFLGINTRPALDALARFLSMFNQQTTAGKAIAAMMQRWGNLWMRALGGIEPFASQVVDGLIVGFLSVEATVWKAIGAMAPFVALLIIAKNKILGSNAAFEAGKVAVYGLAVVLTIAAVDALVLAASLAAIGVGMYALAAITLRWIPASMMAGSVFTSVLQNGGTLLEALKLSLASFIASFASIPVIGSTFAKWAESLRSGIDPKLTAKSGKDAGEYLGKGMASGILAALPDVTEASGALVKAADGAVRAKAEIRSPSRLFTRHGRYMAAGVAVGMMAGAGGVQVAAREALVPDLGPLESRAVQFDARALGRPSAAGARKVEVHLHGDVYGVDDLEARIRRAIQEDNAAAAKELGTS